MKKAIFIAGAAGLLLALTLVKTDYLTLRLPDSGNRIYFLGSMDPGERFSITYRHSVEKTRVIGIFQISSQPSVLAVETRMTSVGTGLPNTVSNRTTREGKWIVVDEQEKEIKGGFRFFIASVNHTVLTTPGERIDLNQIPSGTVILVNAERLALIHYLFYQWNKGINSRTI